MDFHHFEQYAHEVFGEIPEEYRAGVDTLRVVREAQGHPELPGVWTMGECQTEEHISDFGSAETTRSAIALYWGSFREVSDREGFDWEEEIWETLTHELRHHLESLARDDALEEVDYAADEAFRRFEGSSFDPWYYQRGDEEAPGVFRVERSIYIEQLWREVDFLKATRIDFTWDGIRYSIPRPLALGDVHFVLPHGVRSAPDVVELVLLRRRSWSSLLRGVFRSRPPRVLESEAEAVRSDLDP